MIRHFRAIPWHVLLLPLFFVLHGYVEYFGFISFVDSFTLAINFIVMALCIFLVSWLIFRHLRKAAVMTTSWMGLYLFFGAFYDFMKANSPWEILWKYRFLAPFFILLLLAVFLYLMKTHKDFSRTTLFLNLLLLIFITTDIFKGVWIVTHPVQHRRSFYDFDKTTRVTIPDTCKRPDIYFLLFDEYANSLSLKERYHFENDLDSFLLRENFSLQHHSTSNYNSTPFSIASVLNMNYLEGVSEQRPVNRKDYLECNPKIRDSRLVEILGTNGYEIVNLSMFDLGGHPSRIKQAFLPVKTKMIAESTLFPRLYRDFDWLFKTNKLLAFFLRNEDVYQHNNNNQLFFREVMMHAQKKEKPKFIYAHFFLPHLPYFYDEKGNPRSLNEPATVEAYLNYLRYTNTQIKQLVKGIKSGTSSEAVILLLSDHGYRYPSPVPHPVWHFQNLNAIYFPGQQYGNLYDSMSNVNVFRTVLNSLFAQNLPRLPDSTIFLFDLNPDEIRRK
ncbi:MAG TPA: sulfatase-like hydrolase/transferase [Flavitalea sp.]|nr:sulfatase-like hydrolase/transferase [Flavitalea sp.]